MQVQSWIMKCILRMKKLVVMVVTMQKSTMEMVTMVSVLSVVVVVTTMVMVETMVVTTQEDNQHQFATVLVLMQRQIWSTSHPIHINNIITILLDQEQGFSITWKATFPALLPLLLSSRSNNKPCLELTPLFENEFHLTSKWEILSPSCDLMWILYLVYATVCTTNRWRKSLWSLFGTKTTYGREEDRGK